MDVTGLSLLEVKKKKKSLEKRGQNKMASTQQRGDTGTGRSPLCLMLRNASGRTQQINGYSLIEIEW